MFINAFKIVSFIVLCVILQIGAEEGVIHPTNLEKELPLNDNKSGEIFDAATIYTSCGGVIKVGAYVPAYIEYGMKGSYNKELCVWTIRNTDRSGLHFYKTQSGFGSKDDFIQISTFDEFSHQGPQQNVIMGQTYEAEHVDIIAPLAFVIFSSGNFNGGVGFRMEIGTFDDPPYNYTHRDFFATSYIGATSVTLPYVGHLMTSYVILPKNAKSLQLVINYEEVGEVTLSVFQLERIERAINFRRLDEISGTSAKRYEVFHNTNCAIFFTSAKSFLKGDLKLNWHAGIIAPHA